MLRQPFLTMTATRGSFNSFVRGIDSYWLVCHWLKPSGVQVIEHEDGLHRLEATQIEIKGASPRESYATLDYVLQSAL